MIATAHGVVGDAAKDDAYSFTAKLDIGGKRACSGALIDSQWIITAASCFQDSPDQSSALLAGKPKEATTATISGQVRDAAELVPRTDRDLMMVRLATPVTDIAPLAVSAKAPTAGEELTVAGFGRTKTEWVPDKLHTTTVTAAARATTVALTPTTPTAAAVCKGDTGGPTLRTANGHTELAGINSRSWQGGCLGETETRTGALDARTDDITDWIKKITFRATLVNQNSNKCLEIDNSGKDNGARAQQWDCKGQPGAVWLTKQTPDGEHITIVNNNSGKCLEIDNSSKDNGARAQQWDCKDQPGAVWLAKPTTSDSRYVTLVNVNSGKCLEAADSRKDNGAPVQQWTCVDIKTQKWELQGTPDTRLIKNVETGKVLDTANPSTASG